MWILEIFRLDFGVWGGSQSIGNAYELQIHKFSAHSEPYESSFDDFHDFSKFSMHFWDVIDKCEKSWVLWFRVLFVIYTRSWILTMQVLDVPCIPYISGSGTGGDFPDSWKIVKQIVKWQIWETFGCFDCQACSSIWIRRLYACLRIRLTCKMPRLPFPSWIVLWRTAWLCRSWIFRKMRKSMIFDIFRNIQDLHT